MILNRMLRAGRRLTAHRFIRSVVVVASGTAGAQAINMAFSPVITRIYGPEAFGVLGSFQAVVAVLSTVAGLAFPIAIVLPKADRDAYSLMNLSLLAAAITGALTAAVLAAQPDRIAQALSLQPIASLLLLLPVAMFLATCGQVGRQWLIRKKQFGASAKVGIAHILATNVSKVGFGWFWATGATLILVSLFGALLNTLLLLVVGRRLASEQDEEPGAPRKSLRKIAHEYRDFPIFRAPQALVNAMTHGLPVVLLAALFGPAAAGYYSLSRTVLLVPTNLIGRSVYDVFYPHAADLAKEGRSVRPLLIKATASMAAVGVAPFALLIVFGPWLFSLVFGQEWEAAGTYTRWLALWFFVGFINRPSVGVISVIGRQDLYLVYEILSLILRFLALVLGFYWLRDDVAAIALFSIAGVALNVCLIAGTVRLAATHVSRTHAS